MRSNCPQKCARLPTILAPLTRIPHVSTQHEILPRVLAIAQAFFDDTDATFSEAKFTEFCLSFEDTAASRIS